MFTKSTKYFSENGSTLVVPKHPSSEQYDRIGESKYFYDIPYDLKTPEGMSDQANPFGGSGSKVSNCASFDWMACLGGFEISYWNYPLGDVHPTLKTFRNIGSCEKYLDGENVSESIWDRLYLYDDFIKAKTEMEDWLIAYLDRNYIGVNQKFLKDKIDSEQKIIDKASKKVNFLKQFEQ